MDQLTAQVQELARKEWSELQPVPADADQESLWTTAYLKGFRIGLGLTQEQQGGKALLKELELVQELKVTPPLTPNDFEET